MKKIGTVSILGTLYEIFSDDESNPKMVGNYGYIEHLSKKIFIAEFIENDDELTVERSDLMNNRAVRHEIIHGFLYEAGLGLYFSDETLVDALAILFPKIQKAFELVEVIE